jgi:glycosyltransferase involved in cell wall biosynthesis
VRIGIDGRELGGQSTGVGRYLGCLLHEWALSATEHTFSLYSPDGKVALPAGLVGEVVVVPGAGGTRWEQIDLAGAVRRDRPDVLFAPGYTAPLRIGIPSVVVVHDVSFVAHPEWFSWREGARRRLLTRLSARRARYVLTVSEFSRQEIVTALAIEDSKVRVVRHGIGLPVTAHAGTRREPLVLFVGTILNRRHVPLLIEAFSRIAGQLPAARLEIVGRNRTHPHQDVASLVDRAGLGPLVSIRDWIPDGALADLYARATAFAFLSEYEGHGLTPLEALAAGVAPVVLDTPVAREAYGEAAIRVAADASVVAAALRDALDPSSVRRAAIMREAPAVLARYDWRRAARETLAILEEAATR